VNDRRALEDKAEMPALVRGHAAYGAVESTNSFSVRQLSVPAGGTPQGGSAESAGMLITALHAG